MSLNLNRVAALIYELRLILGLSVEVTDTDWTDAVASDSTEPRTYEGD